LVIIGAGGFGRDALDVVLAHNRAISAGHAAFGTAPFEMLGFLDDAQPDPEVLAAQGSRHLGGVELLPELADAWYLVGVADPVARRRLAALAEEAGLRPASAIHPSAVVGSATEILPGTVICPNASVSTRVRLGPHTQLNANCAIGHDSCLEGYVTIYPGAAVSGAVTLGVGVQIGTGAVVLQGLHVGAGTFVGAGAAVIADLPAGVVAVGVPAQTHPRLIPNRPAAATGSRGSRHPRR
jgi:sugar O-acyltransferase (sialic acid O-acetyltransferase NeuD family)